MKLTRKRVALAVVAVALAATGSVGWAAIGDGGTVQGCVANNGTIDAIDPVTQACRDRQTPVEWYTKAGADAAFAHAGDPAPIAGHDESHFGPTAVEPGSMVSIFVACPAGNWAISGGYRTSRSETSTVAPEDVDVVASYPFSTGWLVEVHNGDPVQRFVTAYAVCANVG